VAIRLGTRLALILLIGTTIGCDRVTKHLAGTMLAGTPQRSYLADSIRLEYTENPGGFLSLGATLPSAARTALFTVGTGCALMALAFLGFQSRRRALSLFALSLFVAGGASNWIDRAVRGSVVDFVTLGVGPVRTGIFNIADVAILAGASLLIVAEIRYRGFGIGMRPRKGRL
jgi:signal peptidase II